MLQNKPLTAGFTLHPKLDADSLFIRDLGLSQLRLFNQKTIPWLLLVPRRAEISEIYQLDRADRIQLMDEISQTSLALEQLYAPDKINVGALGNIVPQLHVHIIARFTKDAAWPAPVWGNVEPEPYLLQAIGEIKTMLNREELWVTTP